MKCGVILFQENVTPRCHCDVQNLMQLWGWDVLAHSPYSPDLVCMIIGCLHVLKNSYGGKHLNWKITSTLLSLLL